MRAGQKGASPTGRPASGRRAFTLIEVMLAVTVSSVVFGVTMAFMNMSQKSMVKTTEHAEARIEAMAVLDIIDWDLERIVVGDEVDDPNANVIDPFKKMFNEATTEFGFFAFHHFEYDPTDQRMVLVPGWVDYRVQPRADGWGVDLLRNNKPINRAPLADVKIAELDRAEADKLGISPRHCITVKVYPLGLNDWLKNKDISSEANAVRRVFHLKAIESRYACLMSIKRAIQTNPDNAPKDPKFLALIAALPDPPPTATSYPGGDVVLGWMQPQMVVKSLFVAQTFDDSTSDQNKLAPPGTGPTSLPPPSGGPPPTGPYTAPEPGQRGADGSYCHKVLSGRTQSGRLEPAGACVRCHN